MVFGTVPDGLFGPLLLIDRESYQKCGGHETVRDKVLENFRLAAHCRALGIPVRSANGARAGRSPPGSPRRRAAGPVGPRGPPGRRRPPGRGCRGRRAPARGSPAPPPARPAPRARPCPRAASRASAPAGGRRSRPPPPGYAPALLRQRGRAQHEAVLVLGDVALEAQRGVADQDGQEQPAAPAGGSVRWPCGRWASIPSPSPTLKMHAPAAPRPLITPGWGWPAVCMMWPWRSARTVLWWKCTVIRRRLSVMVLSHSTPSPFIS